MATSCSPSMLWKSDSTCPYICSSVISFKSTTLLPVNFADSPSGSRIRPRPWILVVLSREESDTNINLISPPADTGIISGIDTTHNFRSDSEETTTLSCEINEVTDLRTFMRDMPKKRKTDWGIVNVVISNEEEVNIGRLGYCRKMRADHVGPSVMMANTLTSPLVNSLSVASESFPIVARGSSLPPTPLCIPPPLLPFAKEPLDEHDGKLLPGHGQNEELVEKLRAAQLKTNELFAKVMVERESNTALDAELRRTVEEHRAIVSQIVAEHKAAMASLK
ncbi:hypothetical protein PVK06_007622 [Gossypium arboreum]|uniref:Uncharacterized protein n=1 Tax=Gossypium arboreum TaxID=29729 RepID=A0ABR0QHV9_GOSAR|nr:hypothetical protein PVK06_007622 [Gossypium arboreum]